MTSRFFKNAKNFIEIVGFSAISAGVILKGLNDIDKKVKMRKDPHEKNNVLPATAEPNETSSPKSR